MSSFTADGFVRLTVEKEDTTNKNYDYERYPFTYPDVLLDGICESYYPQVDFSWGQDSVVVMRDGEIDVFSKTDFTEMHAIDESGKECWMDGRSAPYDSCWGGKYLPERRPGREYTVTNYNTVTMQKKTFRVVLEETTQMDEMDIRRIRTFIKTNSQNEQFQTDGNGFLIKYTGTDGRLVIPGTIEKISPFAEPFWDVKQLTIPNTLVEFPDPKLFPNLEEITVSDDHPAFYVEDGCLIHKPSGALLCATKTAKIPDDGSVSRISNHVFAGRADLVEIELPDSVQEVDAHAFDACENLQKIKLSSNLKQIGNSAFQNCSFLTEVTLPDGLVRLGDRAFCGCTHLAKIKIPDSVENVGEHAFYNCANLNSASFSSSTVFAPNAFESCISLKNMPVISKENLLDLDLISIPVDDLPF